LLFLENHAKNQSTAPKLYAMYRTFSTGQLCLIMERIHAETLEVLWPGLTEAEKSAICAELKRIINTLRELPAPGYYGGVGRTCVPYHLFWVPEKKKEICGPFDSETEFNAGILEKLKYNNDMNRGYMTPKIEFYERHLDTMLSGHGPPVFTHSDLQRKNILARQRSDSSFEVFIIDWETAGWYPRYWEFTVGFASMQWMGDRPTRLEQIIEPWPCEGTVWRVLYQELVF
jgi:hypothetical protein